ncbi:LysM peptidoglycan-binding domain-containing protein [Streptomyces sp. Tu102]|uniref:LysM peptidoglycan-binding domain-containing protein n=1 Tax=Streptomyces TaxID=1883 RepID=UPI001BDDC995|nr:LysM peptidoglycan-binding domain-containing protein [Streptomyces sp. Tu102]MBT1098109.1 LysM peptidoglycan-binding domain-containing protein [Streptomyces sp. Tu102]
MRTSPSPAATAGRTLGRVLKAVLSLIVLTVAVAGLPLLLAWATPVIWASTHDDLMHLLDRQDTGAVFLLLLVVTGWIGWAQFAFCAVREFIAQLRGRTWHAPRGLGSSQRAAALLIGSILVLLPTSSALASDAQAAPATTAARIPGQTTPAPHAPGSHTTSPDQAHTSAASTSASRASYTVREARPAESLWAIAERELGDGERWREIADLNEGQAMVDGQVFRANSFLQPGWQLQMPDPGEVAGGFQAQLGNGTPAAGEGSEHVVTVQSGDYLSKIAEEELGDGNDWPRLFDASRGKPQPDGLPAITNPDLIRPGQHVTVPGTQPGQEPQEHAPEEEESGSTETTPPAVEKPDATQNPDEGTGEEQAPAPSHTAPAVPEAPAPSASPTSGAQQPGQDQLSPSASASAAPRPTGSASAASPSAESSGSAAASSAPAASQAPTPATAPASSPLNLRTVLGAGALLAAAVTGALALRRTLQRRRRTPGETIAIAPEPSTAEAQLAAAAEPGGAARLDVALRTLAHQLADTDSGGVLPALRAARIGTRNLEVLPEDLAQETAAPFVSGQGGWWVLPSDAVLLDEDAAREVPAPYPELVTIGTTRAGDLLLLNLAQVPALLLEGAPVHITEVCTSLALELGISPWASEVEVVVIGFGEDLPQLLPTARIAYMRQAEHALRDLSERLLETHQMPETQRQPYLLLCAGALDADVAWQFADVISRSGSVPVTLVAPASSAAACFPEAELLNTSVTEPQHLDHAGIDITVQRLEHAAYMQITTALKVSGQPAHPAEGPWRDLPEEPEGAPQPLVAEKPIVSASVPASPAQAQNESSEGFPALIAATTDPSGLRLLPAATLPGHGHDEPGPGTGAASSTAPDPTALDHAEEAGENADPADDYERLQAEGAEAHALRAPEIRVLGPVEVTGVDSTGHGPRMAQLAALLLFRPGRSADVLCSDMDPVNPWSASTLNARIGGLRRSLGNDPSGNPYVPRRSSGEDPYQLSPTVRCDWTSFLQFVERALPMGPTGLPDLEKALGLVRGKPFGGKPLPWAQPLQQEMITRIIDVAHTVATYRTPPGPHHDLSPARQAVATGLDVDPTAELLYRDWLRIEHAAGNRQGLHTAITRVQQVNQALDCSLETETFQLINQLLNNPSPEARKAL